MPRPAGLARRDPVVPGRWPRAALFERGHDGPDDVLVPAGDAQYHQAGLRDAARRSPSRPLRQRNDAGRLARGLRRSRGGQGRTPHSRRYSAAGGVGSAVRELLSVACVTRSRVAGRR